ncbi:MAG: maltotransferase domain-containing protein, partial [Nitrospira sp.]
MPGNPASPQLFRDERRQRVAIEHVQPELDGGRYPVKRVVGDTILVEVDLFAD